MTTQNSQEMHKIYDKETTYIPKIHRRESDLEWQKNRGSVPEDASFSKMNFFFSLVKM